MYREMTKEEIEAEKAKDIAFLRERIPVLAGLVFDSQVADLYHEFSEQTRSAGWLFVDYGAGPFEVWLKEQYHKFKFVGLHG